MKNNVFFSILLLLFLGMSPLYAQEGGIDPQMLSKIRQCYRNTPQDKALRNAMTHIDINKLALNQANEANTDTYMSHVVKSKGITDQRSSGRCWLFSGLNVLRAKTIRDFDMGAFEFSQNYLFFWDQIEKANLFLQSIIDTRDKPIEDRTVTWLFHHALGDGGQFTGVTDLISKYGLVPKTVMPETYSSNHTARMSMLLNLKLREFGLELREMQAGKKDKPLRQALRERKEEMLGFVYRFLVLNLGEPPESFTWTAYNAKGEPRDTRTYTPLAFYQEYVGKDLQEGYVLMMNDPSREFYKTYEIAFDRHVYDGHNWIYINLPMEAIKEMAIASIKDSTMLYFSCDVGKFSNRETGFLDIDCYDYASLMGTTFGMDKRDRILTGASGSSHAMTLSGVNLTQDGTPNRWLVENSWGMTGQEGHFIMTDAWFNEYMFRLVVEKKYVPAGILQLLEQKPVLLPPWDPMFSPDE